jgi:hypothetical protein
MGISSELSKDRDPEYTANTPAIKILKQASEEHRVKLFLTWEHDLDGYVFPCNETGEVDHKALTTAGLRNLIALRQGKHPTIPASVKPVIIQRKYTVKHHAVGQCECGQRVTLDNEINVCKCGRRYGIGGQLLAPRRELSGAV